MIIKYDNLLGKEKETEIPDHAFDVHFAWGSWKRDCGVFLRWREHGEWKSKLLSTTKWRKNLAYFKDQIAHQLINKLNETNQ